MENNKISAAKWFWQNYYAMVLVFIIVSSLIVGVMAKSGAPSWAAASFTFVMITITCFSAVYVTAEYIKLRLSDSIEAVKNNILSSWLEPIINKFFNK